jgi:phosphoribosylformylglycinamidine cyclo-ligase
VLIGIESSGLHSNGFSLARKIVFDIAGLSVNDRVPELGSKTLGEVLLEPTRIYVRSVQKLLMEFGANTGIHGIAHITGGGLKENTSRILPKGRTLDIIQNLPVPPVFSFLQTLGNVDDSEMERVFNMGTGLVLAVKEEIADAVIKSCEYPAQVIGRVR